MKRAVRRRQNNSRPIEQLEQRLVLTTITVTSLVDEVKLDGNVTLREAILAANADTSLDGSETGDGDDRIVFAEGLTGSVDLQHPLVVTDSLEIIGHGVSDTWITGDSTAIRVDGSDNPNVSLHLQDLRIRLADIGVSFTADTGRLSLVRTQIRNGKTGIRGQAAEVAIENSDISGNDSLGIDLTLPTEEDTLSLRNTRISQNGGSILRGEGTARFHGLLYHQNTGPLLSDDDIRTEIANATFTENTAGAIQRYDDAEVAISHSTIVNNTGYGVAGNNRVRISNSVVADNFDTDGVRVDITSRFTMHGSFVSAFRYGYGSGPDDNGNVIGTRDEPLDAMLGPLTNNGGPLKTMMPLPGSPLIDTGTDYTDSYPVVATDKLGNFRRVGLAPDRGAVEFRNGPRVRITQAEGPLSEGESVTVEVSLLDPIDEPVTLQVGTLDLSTVAGRDYELLTTELTFNGTPDQVLEVTLQTTDDDEYERNERLEFAISSEEFSHLAYPVSEVEIRSDETRGLGLTGGILLGKGTPDDDIVTISQTATTVTADLSGETFTVPRSLVEGIDFRLVGGNNKLTIGQWVEFDASIVGGKGNDTITTSRGRDSVLGSGGRDIIKTGLRTDTIRGGSGQDTINGQGARDIIYGDAGSDILIGEEGNDELHGNTGADSLDGGSGYDLLTGGGGPDTLIGGTGSDTMYGFVSPQSAEDEPGTDAPNELIGGDSGDLLYGGYAADRLVGGEGRDSLYGFGELFGGAENDNLRTTVYDSELVVTGTAMHGGPGRDSLSNEYRDFPATLQGGSGRDRLRAGNAGDLLIGSIGHDNLAGGEGNDQLKGGAGNDLLYSLGGDDRAWGGDGDDSIQGGEGNDTIFGGNDHDIVLGESGDDSLEGGGGRDLIVGDTGADMISGDVGEDILVAGTVEWRYRYSDAWAARAEWTADRTFAVRQANFTDGTGSDERLNKVSSYRFGAYDVFLLDSGEDQNVVGDEDIDTVIGGNGNDWLFFDEDDDWTQ